MKSSDELVKIVTALLARSKGFDYCPEYYYFPKDRRDGYNIIHKNYSFSRSTNTIEEDYIKGIYNKVIPAPSLYQLKQWLWDKHKLHVSSNMTFNDKDELMWYYDVEKFDNTIEWVIRGEGKFETYEQALEAGLVKALNLI